MVWIRATGPGSECKATANAKTNKVNDRTRNGWHISYITTARDNTSDVRDNATSPSEAYQTSARFRPGAGLRDSMSRSLEAAQAVVPDIEVEGLLLGD